MKNRNYFVAALLLLALSLPVWGGIKFVKTWKNPAARPANWKGKKVAVFIFTVQPANRESAEGALIDELSRRGIQGIAGSSLFQKDLEKNRDEAKRLLADAGATGVVVMRVVEVKPEMFATPGQPYISETTYVNFSSYYNYAMNNLYVPASVGMKMNVLVETLIFSLDQDLLVWKGDSEITDAKEADKVVRKLTEKAGNELKKAGLVAR